MDCITITDLELYSHHGVMKEENVLGQKFLVSAKLYTDVAKAGRTDDIEDSIDYASVAHFIENFMKNRTFQLIEAVACQLANELLYAYDLVKCVSILVKKPWAPILLPLDTVSVEITRGWQRAYLSVGSNIGEKEEHIRQAIELLKETKGIKNVRVSNLIVTKPYGYKEQDDFLNGAISLDTLLQPEELLTTLHDIEEKGERVRDIHWGPRTIDLDLLLYGDIIMETKDLILPHRELHLRKFVLEPLAELAPWTRHPVLGKTIAELRDEVEDE